MCIRVSAHTSHTTLHTFVTHTYAEERCGARVGGTDCNVFRVKGGPGDVTGFYLRCQGELLGLWDPQNRDLRRKPPPETKFLVG